MAALYDIRLTAGTCALTGVEDADEGAIGLGLEDFDVEIPEDFRHRYNAWYQSTPQWNDPRPDYAEVHAVARELAKELAALLGQPVAYDGG